MRLTGHQVRALNDFIGGDHSTDVTIDELPERRLDGAAAGGGDGPTTLPAGLWVWCTEHPEEGGVHLPVVPPSGYPSMKPPGMREVQMPEAVILEVQTAAHRKRAALETAKAGHEEQKSLADRAGRRVAQEEHELRQLITFLAEHNAECCDWWAEFGMLPTQEATR